MTERSERIPNSSPEAEDPRLTKAMEEYLAELETGSRPDRKQFLARYVDIAEELAAGLEGIDFIYCVAPQLKEAQSRSSDTTELFRPLATLGDYRIVRELGRGGMGIVYEAEQLSLGRRVALKVLPFAGVLSDNSIKRFKNEARAAASLEHPNIVPVYAVSQDRGVHFFAMSLIDGLTLAQVIADLRKRATQGKSASLDKLSIDLIVSQRCKFDAPANDFTPLEFPRNQDSGSTLEATAKDMQAALSTYHSLFDRAYFRRLAEIGIQAADALQHAHEHGIVHRDIKPGNLMIDGNGKLWVTDFGLAQFENDPAMTMNGDLMGTIHYMSPEQALGNRTLVNHLTDVYSLGVTLYELLALQPPFVGENRETLLRRISVEEPSSPQRLNRAMPDDLVTIVMKAMSKIPQDRYATAGELAADLRRWLEHRAILARQPTLLQRASKWSRRNRTLVTAMVVAVAILGVSAGGIFWWQMKRESIILTKRIENERRSLAAERVAKQAEEKQRHRAEASEREATSQLYYADMRAGLSDWTSGNLARLSRKLLRHAPRLGTEDHRGWEWYHLFSLCHEEERTLTHRFGSQVVACISPDGKYVASAGVDTTVKVFETNSWRRLTTWISPNDGIALAPSWSPNSQQLAWGVADELYLMDIRSRNVKCLKSHSGSILAIAWSADGKFLAFGGTNKNIGIWETSALSFRRILEEADGEILSIAWHPDGERIASIIGSRLAIINSVTGDRLDKSEYTNLGLVAWSPDGSELALGTLSGDCQIHMASDFSLMSQWKAHNGPINWLTWDQTRKTILTAGCDHLIRFWDPSSANCELTLRGHLNQVQSVSIDRRGRTVVSSGLDGLVKVWTLPFASQPLRPHGNQDGCQDIVWSANGKLLTLGNGSTSIWNIDNNESLKTAEVRLGHLSRFSADGKLLVTAIEGEEGREFVILDAESSMRLHSIHAASNPSNNFVDFAFAPNLSSLAISSGGKLDIFNLAKGEVDFAYSGILTIRSLEWSPDGRFLAIAGNGEPADGGNLAHAAWVHVFDLEKRERVFKFRHGSARVDASAVAWSPDGKKIVSGDINGLAEIRDVTTNRKVASANLHTASINALAWSPDGRRIASGSADRSVRVWDPGSGEELLKLDGFQSDVKLVRWSSNGEQLAAAMSDGAVFVWDASRGYAFVHFDDYFIVRSQDFVSRAVQLMEEGNNDEAVLVCHQAMKESVSRFGQSHRETLWIMSKLAVVLYDAGQVDDAKAMWSQLLTFSAEERDDYSGVVNFVIRRANSARLEGRIQEATSLYELLLRANVKDHFFLNKVAWELATNPDPNFRNPHRAVEMATKAIQLQPMGAQILNTLGVAHYRAENWQAAIHALLKSEELSPNNRTGFNAFFLAMAHWHLNQKEEARKWFDRGVVWMGNNKHGAELHRFRAEASELMGAENR